jgi:hypothetical protein
MSIETPKFNILQKDGKFEIREYQEYINASVEIESEYKSALNEGFRILADYIFGNNRAKSKIDMTAPVTEQEAKSKKIEMTSPVTSAKVPGDKRYLISFTMPAKYTLETLPEPANKAISINKVAPHKTAALKFSGYSNEATITKKIQELEDWLKEHKLQTKGGFVIAQYNPPWILGPFRRNVIIVELL